MASIFPELDAYVEEYRDHIRRTVEWEGAQQLADDFHKGIIGMYETSHDKPEAIELIDKLRRVMRQKRPFEEKQAAVVKLLPFSVPEGRN